MFAGSTQTLADVAGVDQLRTRNIHFNLAQPNHVQASGFLARSSEITHAAGEIVRDLEGSFSAEHGAGKLKAHRMTNWRGGCELDIMKRIRMALETRGLMNFGKLFL